jgi:hypothetical protein
VNLKPLRILSVLLLAASTLAAWSPRFHEAQTQLALGLIPKRMARFLKSYPRALSEGARGVANDQVPAPEDVEEQFLRILQMSEEQRRPEVLIRELGTLAHLVQLLIDPSATAGVTPLREQFESYGDEHLPRLVANREPFWALTAPLDPRPRLLQWSERKYERHRLLLQHFDTATGHRIGPWDILSPPFAQLQLSYSNGVNATANLWIQTWRAVGDYWETPEN